MRTIYREEIPVDDRWHRVVGDAVLHVGCRRVDVVEFWHLHDSEQPSSTDREYRVVGTGHPIPDDADYIGTVVAPGGLFVWHLVARWTP